MSASLAPFTSVFLLEQTLCELHENSGLDGEELRCRC